MALRKEIITDIGVPTTYHRIVSVTNNSGLVDINVASYVSETYRDIERDLYDTASQFNYYIDRMHELAAIDNPTEAEQSELETISNKIDELDRRNGNFAMSVTNIYRTYRLSDSEDISYSELYAELKKEELFADAEDVM